MLNPCIRSDAKEKASPLGLATKDDLVFSGISEVPCPCSFYRRSAVDYLAFRSAAVLVALPAGAAVGQDGLPDAEEVDSVSRVAAEAAVPGEPQEDEPVVQAWSAEFPVDGCSADEHSAGEVVPESDPAAC